MTQFWTLLLSLDAPLDAADQRDPCCGEVVLCRRGTKILGHHKRAQSRYFKSHRRLHSKCLCDFPGHQILKFDLYFLHSIGPPLVIQVFPVSMTFLPETGSVLKPDLIQFGPKTGYSARNIDVVHDTILCPSALGTHGATPSQDRQ